MTRDHRVPTGTDPIDDATIEQLIREVAADWTMPPVRLDAPAWRERVRGRVARRLDTAGTWLGRLGQAATAAVVLTVAGALIAVLLTGPGPDAGKSPEPTDRSTPRATDGARATPLPKLLVEGALPEPAQVVVQTEQGDFAIVDLATGTIGGPLTGARYGSDLRVAPDGSMVCLCLSESLNESGSPTHAEVTLDRFDANGKRTSSTPIEAFDGRPDPRDEGVFLPDRPPHVLVGITYSADGRYGFVGWSAREHPAWRSGIVAVDLSDGSVAGRLALPDAPTGAADSRRVTTAPRVVGSTDGDGLLVATAWYEWSPPASETARYTFGSDVVEVDFAAGSWSNLTSVPLADDCGDRVAHGGRLPDGGTWLACSRGGAALTILRRIDGGGSVLPDVTVSGGQGIDGDVTALSRDRSALFAWDPAAAVLTRIDIATGETRQRSGRTARVDEGPLAAFGHWLAPSAAAKSILQGAIVVSPDGSRVYAIGVVPGADQRELTGSAGVFVFDAASLEPIGEVWQPTADFVSLALSTDGRYAYVAGMPGVDERGQHRIDQDASITVFDASDGSVRLIAGQLTGGLILFTRPTVD